MTQTFHRHVAVNASGIAALNATLNGLYTWLLWRSQGNLTLTGDAGIAFDLAGTPVWIAVLTTLMGTATIRGKLWEGRVASPSGAVPAAFSLLPFNIVGRATTLGAMAFVLLALPLWAALQAAGDGALTITFAVAAKIVLTLLLTFAIVPIVLLAAATDMQPARRIAVLGVKRHTATDVLP